MPENYITVDVEQGGVHIAVDVIAAIVGAAISEVDGVAGLTNATVEPAGGRAGLRTAVKGVNVAFDQKTVCVDAGIFARYGESVASIGEKAQKAAAAAVESMTGLSSVVNVHVAGVAFDR